MTVQIPQEDPITATLSSLSFIEQAGEQAIKAAEEQLDCLRSDLLYYISEVGTDLARVQAERDELRRLLRQCLPYVKTMLDGTIIRGYDELDHLQLIDAIETFAPQPEPPELPATCSDDGDIPAEVPF